MMMAFVVDPDRPQDTLAACEDQLRLLSALFSAAGTDLDLNGKALCALMLQLKAMADAIAAVEELLRPPPCARAA